MAEASKDNAFKNIIPTSSPDFAQKVTDFYEARIAEALALEDVGERYLALRKVAAYLTRQGHENAEKIINVKRTAHVLAGTAFFLFVGATAGFGTIYAFAALAKATATIAVSIGIPSLVGITALIATPIIDKIDAWATKKYCSKEVANNTVLKGLFAKIRNEMTAIEKDTPVPTLLQSSQVSVLKTIKTFAIRLRGAFNAANNPVNQNNNSLDGPAKNPLTPS
jgi:hypothetical protein